MHRVLVRIPFVGSDRLSHQRNQIQRFQVKLHLSGLEFFQIKDVVDQQGQSFAVAFGRVQQSPDLLGQSAGMFTEHQAQCTADRCQGRAKFMAHGGNKFTFHAFIIFSFSDVTHDAGEQRLVLQLHFTDCQLHREAAAVFAPPQNLPDGSGHASLPCLDIVIEIAFMFRVVRLVHQQFDVLPNHFSRCVAKNPLGGRIKGLDTASGINGDDAVDNVIEYRAQTGFLGCGNAPVHARVQNQFPGLFGSGKKLQPG